MQTETEKKNFRAYSEYCEEESYLAKYVTNEKLQFSLGSILLGEFDQQTVFDVVDLFIFLSKSSDCESLVKLFYHNPELATEVVDSLRLKKFVFPTFAEDKENRQAILRYVAVSARCIDPKNVDRTVVEEYLRPEVSITEEVNGISVQCGTKKVVAAFGDLVAIFTDENDGYCARYGSLENVIDDEVIIAQSDDIQKIAVNKICEAINVMPKAMRLF